MVRQQVEPVRWLALLALALLQAGEVAGGGQGAELTWRLELSLAPQTELRIRLEAPGELDGSTELAVSAGWGGVTAAGEDLDGLRAWGEDGGVLAVERPAPARWIVDHAPGARLTVEYVLRANANQTDSDPRGHYRPVLTPHVMHLIGELALVRPTRLDEGTRRRVALEWRGFEEAGWEVASSFGTGTDRLELELPLRDVRQGLYLAGEIELLRREVGGRPLVVALAGSEWAFAPEELADLTAEVVALERGFFDDFEHHPYYLVSLLPVGAPDPRDHSLGGTGLHRAFATFTPPGISLAEGSPLRLPVVRLLLHDLFHEWNGHVLDRESPEELSYWFSEGFTSFYTRRLALRGGWIDAAQYADDLSAVLRDYGSSPEREASAERVRELFWVDRDVQLQPYLRGDLLACLVDHGIRAQSGGERSLDDLMRALVREARATDEGRLVLLRAELIERIGRWAGADVAERVRAVAFDGAPLELPADVLGPALRLEGSEAVPFDLGFDLERSRAAGRVLGLRAGTAAARAGLREGERLAGTSVRPGQADAEVELHVGPAGDERRVVYLPAGPPVGVQRAVLVEAAGEAALAVL